jgi:hypothetical protein
MSLKLCHKHLMKLISSPKNAPHLSTMGPIARIAVSQAPPGIKGVTIGITMFSTKDFMNAVAAIPMIKAIANGIALFRKEIL